MAPVHRVAVVVDPDYGQRVQELSRQRHVWIVRSPVNDPAVESAIRAVVEEHHGEYSHDPPLTAIEVIGTGASAMVREHLGAYGFLRIEPEAEGFTAFREE